MSSFFDYDKEKSNGFYLFLVIPILIFFMPKYINFFFSKGPQSSIPNFTKIIPNSLLTPLNGNPMQKVQQNLLNLNQSQFMSNPVFLTPTIILITLIIFTTIQYFSQYKSLETSCPDKMKKTSIIPIFFPVISLFLILIFGFTSKSASTHTLALNIGFSAVSIIYFIFITHAYYKWDTSSWLAPIISLIIGFGIKFAFDFGINAENKYINWILLFFVFLMTSNLYTSYYSYSLAINQQKICKTI